MKTHKCGIVGLPNVGKSSLFNFLTESNQAKSENYPFCTIDPNKSLVFFKDPRVKDLMNFSKSERPVYSSLEIIDIAGLVKGASDGEGLGNQFLAHIREVDAICHVVRCFDNEDIVHVMDNVDPVRDLEVILLELKLADLETLANMKSRNSKNPELISKLEEVEKLIQNGDNKIETDLPLLSNKPFLVLGNGTDLKYVNKISEYCLEHNIKFINFNIDEKNPENITLLLKEIFNLLNIIFFFTTGKQESRSWAIKEGTNAKNAAGEIHTDISNKFIKAEVFNFSELNNSKKIYRNEGKDYIVKNGDIINFKHNG